MGGTLRTRGVEINTQDTFYEKRIYFFVKGKEKKNEYRLMTSYRERSKQHFQWPTIVLCETLHGVLHHRPSE